MFFLTVVEVGSPRCRAGSFRGLCLASRSRALPVSLCPLLIRTPVTWTRDHPKTSTGSPLCVKTSVSKQSHSEVHGVRTSAYGFGGGGHDAARTTTITHFLFFIIHCLTLHLHASVLWVSPAVKYVYHSSSFERCPVSFCNWQDPWTWRHGPSVPVLSSKADTGHRVVL